MNEAQVRAGTPLQSGPGAAVALRHVSIAFRLAEAELKGANVDLAKTFTDRFVHKAASTM